MQRTPLRPGYELLEDRIALSWADPPPDLIPIPTNAKNFKINFLGAAKGKGAISKNEVDYLQFVAPVSQSYVIQVTTPKSKLDPILGLFDAAGNRIAYNDNLGIGPDGENLDCWLSANLSAGERYYIGITRVTGKPRGDYKWSVKGPVGDDLYEDNDVPWQNNSIGALNGPLLIPDLVLNDKVDYFEFDLNQVGSSTDVVRIEFEHKQGNLNLELYSYTNFIMKLVRVSRTKDDFEQISLAGLDPTTYRVRVYGKKGAINPHYDMSFAVPDGGLPDDAYEENDTFGAAKDLGEIDPDVPVTVPDLAMVDNADWFQFTTTGVGSGSSSVSIQFVHAAGDLDLQVYRANNTLARSSLSVTDNESVSLTGLAAGTYYIRVFGKQGAINLNYALSIDASVAEFIPSEFNIELVYQSVVSSEIEQVFEDAVARWEQLIVDDLPDVDTIDDLRIYVNVAPYDGVGGVLGWAGPDDLRSDGSYLPYTGEMSFDLADIPSMLANGSLQDVILHEMGHVLGIGTIWSLKGLITGTTGTNPRFHGAQATAEYNAIFGASETSVPVEGTGGGGTRNAHWRESTFSNELMTGWINYGSNPLSRITVASLADLGYGVNLDLADFFAPSLMAPDGGGGGTGSGASLRDGGGCGCGTCSQFAAMAAETVAEPTVKTSPSHGRWPLLEERAEKVSLIPARASVKRHGFIADETAWPQQTATFNVKKAEPTRPLAAAEPDALWLEGWSILTTPGAR